MTYHSFIYTIETQKAAIDEKKLTFQNKKTC